MSEYPIQGDPTPFSKIYHCIYIHKNKVNGKVYIGQAKGDPCDRWGSNGCNYRKQPSFWSAIQEYGWSNFDHMILETNLTAEQANEAERRWIALYKANNSDFGYNRTGGGKGSYQLTEEAAQKKAEGMARYWASEVGRQQATVHSRAMMGENNPMYGKHHSEETRAKISKAITGEHNPNFGKHFSKDHRAKLSAALSGENNYWYGKTGILNKASKQVYCEELSRIFGSAKEAAAELGIDNSSIGKCCKGSRKTAGGYHWRYATEEEIYKLKGASV